MRKTLIAISTISMAMVTAPVMAYPDPGLGYTSQTILVAPAPAVAVSDPVPAPQVSSTPAPQPAPVVDTPPVAPVEPTPSPTLVERVAPDGTVYYEQLPYVEPTSTWVDGYNPFCNDNFTNLPCDFTSPHFATTLNVPEDIEWAKFFLKLEAGLADGTVLHDPNTGQFTDVNGNVIW